MYPILDLKELAKASDETIKTISHDKNIARFRDLRLLAGLRRKDNPLHRVEILSTCPPSTLPRVKEGLIQVFLPINTPS